MSDDPVVALIRNVLETHHVDWGCAETGIYPCAACDFSHDMPEAWTQHQAEMVAAALRTDTGNPNGSTATNSE